MKKLFSILITLFMLGLGVAADNAQAAGFIELFPVDTPLSTTPRYYFDETQTPYLYMKLAIPDGALAATISGWNDPDGLGYFSDVEIGTASERRASLSDWDSVKKVGPWTVYANYFDSQNNNIVASTGFTVTPEPATMALLLMGGLPLFFKRNQHALKG